MNDQGSLVKLTSTHFTAVVSSLGAELQSFKRNATNEEYMWTGDDAIWAGRAPVLFPIVGGLKDGKTWAKEQWCTLSKHGFARHSDFQAEQLASDHARFTLHSNADTLEQYPWQFELIIDFQLTDDSLDVQYTVSNKDSDTMAFNIGSHPAFRLPLEDASISDYSIRFSEVENADVYSLDNALLSRHSKPYLVHESAFELSPTLFNNDALIFLDIRSREITLEHKEQGHRITVDTGGAPHLGIWAKPNAPYVCIEPWWGVNDFEDASGNLHEKEFIQLLEPSKQFQTTMRIQAH